MTNDGLVGYRRIDGPAGDTIVPDLATALPVPADSGKTYRFRLRPGIRFSSGTLVRPQDFRRALERVFIINHGGGPAAFFYSGLAGASQCERIPQHCDLAQGIVANDRANTVTFHLTAPDPEFLYKLALPFADAVPAGTPGHPDRTRAAARDRPVPDAVVRAGAKLDPGPQPAVPPVVEPGTTRRLPRPDRPAVRRPPIGGSQRRRAWSRRRASDSAAGEPDPRAGDPLRGPAAHRSCASHLRAVREHARLAVQRPRGAPRRQLRHRQEQDDRSDRRAADSAAHLPDPPADRRQATGPTARTRSTPARPASGRHPTSQEPNNSSAPRAPAAPR